MRRALIIFTRIPAPGRTKTRMMPFLTGSECASLHFACLRDIADDTAACGADVFYAYTDGVPEDSVEFSDIIGRTSDREGRCFAQEGEGLGARMENAFRHVLGEGYEAVILIGTDVPYAVRDDIPAAFRLLEEDDLVLGPTEDGGYWLIGLSCRASEEHDVDHAFEASVTDAALSRIFSLAEYGHDKVYEQTVSRIPEGMKWRTLPLREDLDDILDLRNHRYRIDELKQDSEIGRFLNEVHVISVVIPVYNEEKALPGFLSELCKFGDRPEIIFADGGSTDGTPGMIEGACAVHPNYRLITCDKGRGRQLNAGARAARGDILLFLHADAELPDDPCGEIMEVLARRDAGCFGIAFHSSNFFMWTNRIISNDRAFRRQIVFGDQGLFIREKLFRELGGFRDIPIMEDYQLSLDMLERGITIGHTRHRLYVSDRRYDGSTIYKLRVMAFMFMLRRRYRAGEDPEVLAEEYRDIR